MSSTPAACLVCGGEAGEDFEAGGVALRRCARCDFQWRRDPPDDAELEALYGTGYLERWGIDGPETLAQVRAMKEASYRRFLSEVLPHRSSGRLLDLGCALGFSVGVARELGFEAYGLDRNVSAVETARREFGDRVHAGALDEGAFAGLRFDVVTLIDVLEHMADPVASLKTLRERLSEGGVLAAVLPDTASRVRRILGRRWPHYAPEHLWYWSSANLPVFLEAQGFRVLALRTGLRKSFTARYLDRYSRHLGRRPLPGLGALGGLRLRLPTGEMLVVARPQAPAGAPS